MGTELRHCILSIPHLGGGGCERIVSALLPELIHCYRVTLVLQENQVAHPIPETVSVLCLGTNTRAEVSLFRKGIRFMQRIVRLRRVLKQDPPDLMLSFIDLNNVVTWCAHRSLKLSCPIVAVEQTICRSFFEHNPYARCKKHLMLAMLRFVYRRVNELIVLSHAMEDYIRCEVKVDRPMTVIYNGVDTSLCRLPEAAETPESLKLDARFCRAPLRLLNIGRLEPIQKHQDFLIKLFPQIKNRYPEAELFFIGKGKGRQELEAMVQQAGLNDCIHFLGWQRDPASYLRHGDILLHCARYETFGNVLIESLACGTPVIAFGCDPVISELLGSWQGAAVVPVDQAELYLQALHAALREDPEELKKQSREISQLFSLKHTCQGYLEALKSATLPHRPNS